MSKSYVALAQRVCVICGKAYGANEIVLHRELKPVFENDHAIIGFGICPDCESKLKDGFVALVEIDKEKTEDLSDPTSWHRTGKIAFLKKEAWKSIFPDREIPENGIALAEEGLLDKIQKLINYAGGESNE